MVKERDSGRSSQRLKKHQGPYSRKSFPKIGFEVVYENLTAITERDGMLSEACRKYSSDCLQNMIQNELKAFETVANVSFLQEIVTFALLKY